MTPNQPPAKWTRKGISSSGTYRIITFNHSDDELKTNWFVPETLVEQLQSEAYKKGRESYAKEIELEQTELYYNLDKIKEEARADERKKLNHRFVLFACEHSTNKFKVSDIHKYVFELEQPVESKEERNKDDNN